MKKYLILMLVAVLATGCMHHHKKRRVFKSAYSPRQIIVPQDLPTPKEPEMPVSAPEPIVLPEHQPDLVPLKDIPLIPGERAPEKKESEGWWFWGS